MNKSKQNTQNLKTIAKIKHNIGFNVLFNVISLYITIVQL